MRRIKSAVKRHRQSVRANTKNRSIKTEIKTSIKGLLTSNTADAPAKLSEVTSLLDKAAKRNILHKKTVARRKSRMTKMLNKKSAGK